MYVRLPLQDPIAKYSISSDFLEHRWITYRKDWKIDFFFSLRIRRETKGKCGLKDANGPDRQERLESRLNLSGIVCDTRSYIIMPKHPSSRLAKFWQSGVLLFTLY